MFKTLFMSGLCVLAASAQTTTEKIAHERSGPMGITAVLAGPAATIPGAPYSATAVTQRIQFLVDGNRITQTITNKIARDSKGRVYREESLPGPINGGAETPHLVLIEDPVSNLHYTLDPNTKTTYRVPSEQQKKADEAAFETFRMMQPVNDSSNDIQIIQEKTNLDNLSANSVDLGTQNIEGVTARGTKTTRTIPAGAAGNDLPIVITTETWFSPDLKILLMSKSNDPRMGESTYKLTNLVRAEPDASLFQIPLNYKIKDQSNSMIFVKKLDK